MDLSGGGFGWDISRVENTGINVPTSPHARALMMVKKHSSFNGSGKKYGYSGSITLEECLDSFAKEEKIPEVSLRQLHNRMANCYIFPARILPLPFPFLSGILLEMPRLSCPN